MTLAQPRLPRSTGWLRPVVDAAARIRASVHLKLLFGFLAGALLLVAMAILSLVVIGRMNERVQDLDRLQVKTSRAQQMLYAVTAQSHYRAMAILTRDAKYDAQIADAKKTFADLLAAMEQDDPADAQVLREMRTANETYSAASDRVLSLYVAGDLTGASRLHLDEEHPDLARPRNVPAHPHRSGRPADRRGTGGLRIRSQPPHDGGHRLLRS